MSSAGTMLFGILGGSPELQAAKTGPPGLRLTGEYGSQAAFDLEFRAEGVVVGCREATIIRPYTIEVPSNQVLVKVQHGNAPFAVTLGSDGRLTGSGSVRVDGRLVTGVADNGQVTFTPRSTTCAMGILPPVKPGSAAAAAPEAAGKPAGGDAVLAISVIAPATSGAASPVMGRSFLLLNEDLRYS